MNTVSKYDVADVVKHISGASGGSGAGESGISGIFAAILAEISENSLEVNAEGKAAESGNVMPQYPPVKSDQSKKETPTVDQLVAGLNTRIFEESAKETGSEGEYVSLQRSVKEAKEDPSNQNPIFSSSEVIRASSGSEDKSISPEHLIGLTEEISKNLVQETGIGVKPRDTFNKETSLQNMNDRRFKFENPPLDLEDKQENAGPVSNLDAQKLTSEIMQNGFNGDTHLSRFSKEPYSGNTEGVGLPKTLVGNDSTSVRVETLRAKRQVILGPANSTIVSAEAESNLKESGSVETKDGSYEAGKIGLDKLGVFSEEQTGGTPLKSIKSRPENQNLSVPNPNNFVQNSHTENSKFTKDTIRHNNVNGPRLQKISVLQDDALGVTSAKTPAPETAGRVNDLVDASLKNSSDYSSKSSEPLAALSTINPRSPAVMAPMMQPSTLVNSTSKDDHSKNIDFLSGKIMRQEAPNPEKGLIDDSLVNESEKKVNPITIDGRVLEGGKKNFISGEKSNKVQQKMDVLDVVKTNNALDHSKYGPNTTSEDGLVNLVGSTKSVDGIQAAYERNFTNSIAGTVDITDHEITGNKDHNSRASRVPTSNFSAGMQDAIKGHLSQNSLGNSKFTVSLFPENFGKIEIEVAFSEDAGLNVKMFSDNAEATKLLQQNISTLRESLASEKINELVIDLNREKGSDEDFENDSSRNNKLVDADIENLSADDDSQEERVSSGTSFNSSGGLDTYV